MSPTRLDLRPVREIPLGLLAEKTGAHLRGAANPSTLICGLATLDAATPDQVSFLGNLKFQEQAYSTRAAAVFAVKDADLGPGVTVLEVPEVWSAVIKTLDLFLPPPEPRSFTHPTAVVSPEAKIGANVHIGPHAVVESGAEIGDRSRIGAHVYIGPHVRIAQDCLLHPHVTLMEGVEIGARVIIHSGAVLGADGFKFEVTGGRLRKVPQVGTVILEDDVEIGANTTIDRASLAETRIGARTKVDNLVHIAHNVIVGSDCLIVAQVGIAGSTRIGRGCVFAGQVGIADNVTICDGVRLGAKSGVKDSITTPGDYLGAPPMPAREAAKVLISLSRLPDLIRDVRQLRQKIESLTQ